LLDAYWTPRGWRPKPTITADDDAYARRAGYIFDAIPLPHDPCVAALIRQRSRLDARAVAQAFSDSLTTRRLDLRSALGSYGVALNLPAHALPRRSAGDRPHGARECPVCFAYEGGWPENLTVLNFERFKWGGVRHGDPVYGLLDLTLFEAAWRPSAPETREPLLRILDAATSAAADSRPNDLLKRIAPFVPGNADQRRTILACLAYAGILQPRDRPGFFHGYPTERAPPEGKNDWPYPILWWRGRDGVDAAALAFWFPDL